MLNIIKTLLQKFIDDIDSGNCNLDSKRQHQIMMLLSNMQDPDQRMSKTKACEYLGISRAAFDNHVRDGLIPKGIKEDGFKNLIWYKFDLDMYLDNNQ